MPKNKQNNFWEILTKGSQEEALQLAKDENVNINLRDSKNNTPLHIALKNNQIATAKALIERDEIDPSIKNNYGNTPLHTAAKKGHIEIVDTLVNKEEVDPQATNNLGNTPLHIAANNGQLEAVRSLVKQAELNTDFRLKNNKGETALSKAQNQGHQDIIDVIEQEEEEIKYAQDPNLDCHATDNKGNTLLHIAAKNGDTGIVKALIERDDVDITAKNNKGKTPLDIAVNNGQKEVIKHVIQQADIDNQMKDSASEQAYKRAKRESQKSKSSNQKVYEAIGEMIDQQKSDQNSLYIAGKTSLIIAAERGQTRAVKALINQDNTKPQVKDNHGRTALHIAAQKGYKDIAATLADQVDINLDTRDKEGKTASDIAQEQGYTDIAQVINEQSQQHKQDTDNALKIAVDKGQTRAAKNIIKRDKPNIDPTKDDTALHKAAYQGNTEIANDLIQQSSDFDKLYKRLKSGKVSANYVSKNIDNAILQTLKNDLHWAVLLGDRDKVNELINTDVDDVDSEEDFEVVNLSSQDKKGLTPIHLAIRQGYDDIANDLLKANTQAIPSDEKGRSPLLDAIKYNMPSAVNKLVKSETQFIKEFQDSAEGFQEASEIEDPNFGSLLLDESHQQPFPLSYAIEQGNKEAVEVFAKYGHNYHWRHKDQQGQTNAQQLYEKTLTDPNFQDLQQQAKSLLIKNGSQAEIGNFINSDVFKDIDPNERDQAGKTFLYRAVENNNETLVKTLLDNKQANPDLGYLKHGDDLPPLSQAIYDHNQTLANQLLSHGAKADWQSKQDGTSLLHIAATRGNKGILTQKEQANITSNLIKQGADPNTKDHQGLTALHIASSYGNTKVCNKLLKQGADPIVQDNEGMTPLHSIMANANIDSSRTVSTAQALIKNNSDLITTQDQNGKTPCHYLLDRLDSDDPDPDLLNLMQDFQEILKNQNSPQKTTKDQRQPPSSCPKKQPLVSQQDNTQNPQTHKNPDDSPDEENPGSIKRLSN